MYFPDTLLSAWGEFNSRYRASSLCILVGSLVDGRNLFSFFSDFEISEIGFLVLDLSKIYS